MKITAYRTGLTEIYSPTPSGVKLIKTMPNGEKRNIAFYAASERNAQRKIFQLSNLQINIKK